MQTTVPVEFPGLDVHTRLLVVAPHPDDETIATGILIQQVLAAGGVVRVLLLTAGDNNPWPQRWLERRWRIGPRERKRWGERRHAEILRALVPLGLGIDDLQSLGWPDMGLTDLLMKPALGAVQTLRRAIDAFSPSLVTMPSIDDRHPDHGAANVMIRLAAATSACKPPLLAYLVHGKTAAAPLVARVGSPAQHAMKRAALGEHRSQMALSASRLQRLIAGPERYMDVPAKARQPLRVLPWRPTAWMRPRLRLLLASPDGTQSWRWAEAPIRRTGDGSFLLDADAGSTTSPSFVKLTWDMPSLWIFDRWGWHEI